MNYATIHPVKLRNAVIVLATFAIASYAAVVGAGLYIIRSVGDR